MNAEATMNAITAATPTGVYPINPLVKTRAQVYYAYYNTATGQWVRTEHQRIDQWQSMGIAWVKVNHTWNTFKHTLNSAGDRDMVYVTVVGSSADEYVEEIAPTATIIDRTQVGTSVELRVRWIF